MVDLGGTFEVAQPQPIAIGELGARHQLLQLSLQPLDAGLCNFIVASLALRDPPELVADGSSQFGHLGAQIDRRQMLFAISSSPDGLFRSHVQVLIASRLMTSLLRESVTVASVTSFCITSLIRYSFAFVSSAEARAVPSWAFRSSSCRSE